MSASDELTRSYSHNLAAEAKAPADSRESYLEGVHSLQEGDMFGTER